MIKRALVTCGFCLTSLIAQSGAPSDGPAAPITAPAIKGNPRSAGFTSEVVAIANKLRASGDKDAARAYLLKAAQMQESANTAPVRRIAILMDLDSLSAGPDHQAERESFRSKILADWTEALGSDELVVANSAERLAFVLAEEGKLNDADQLWDQAITVIRRNLGPNHPAVEWALTQKLRLEKESDATGELLERATRTKAELDTVRAARGVNSARPSAPKVEKADGPKEGVARAIAPKLISRKDPEYSDEARKKKLQGTVMLTVIVGVNGVPDHIEVLQPLGMGLDEKAESAVRTWLFEPGSKNGVVVPVKATIEVNFRLL